MMVTNICIQLLRELQLDFILMQTGASLYALFYALPEKSRFI